MIEYLQNVIYKRYKIAIDSISESHYSLVYNQLKKEHESVLIDCYSCDNTKYYKGSHKINSLFCDSCLVKKNFSPSETDLKLVEYHLKVMLEYTESLTKNIEKCKP